MGFCGIRLGCWASSGAGRGRLCVGRVRGAETQEGLGQEKAQGFPRYPKLWVSVDKIIFRDTCEEIRTLKRRP